MNTRLGIGRGSKNGARSAAIRERCRGAVRLRNRARPDAKPRRVRGDRKHNLLTASARWRGRSLAGKRVDTLAHAGSCDRALRCGKRVRMPRRASLQCRGGSASAGAELRQFDKIGQSKPFVGARKLSANHLHSGRGRPRCLSQPALSGAPTCGQLTVRRGPQRQGCAVWAGRPRLDHRENINSREIDVRIDEEKMRAIALQKQVGQQATRPVDNVSCRMNSNRTGTPCACAAIVARLRRRGHRCPARRHKSASPPSSGN